MQMDPDLSEHGRRNTEPVTQKSNFKCRSLRRATQLPADLRSMRRWPNAPLYQEGYVQMVPTGGAMTIQRLAVPRHYDMPPLFCRRPVLRAPCYILCYTRMLCGPTPCIYNVCTLYMRRDVTMSEPHATHTNVQPALLIESSKVT